MLKKKKVVKTKTKVVSLWEQKKKQMKKYPQTTENTEKQVQEPVSIYYSTPSLSIFQMIQTIKKGMKFQLFDKITAMYPFSLQEWSNFLNLSERTLQRYKKESKTLDPIYAEKILEISELYYFGAEEVFEDKTNFDNWLSTPNLVFENQAPKIFLDTNLGIQLVKDELGKIQHGVLA